MISARAGIGLRFLPAIKDFSESLVITWLPGSEYINFVEANADQAGHIRRHDLQELHSQWHNLRVLQVLMSPDLEAVATMKDNTRAETTTNESVASDRLPPITEGSNDSE